MHNVKIDTGTIAAEDANMIGLWQLYRIRGLLTTVLTDKMKSLIASDTSFKSRHQNGKSG